MTATNQTRSDQTLAIQKYLQGKSMNQITRETKISKGKVHYITKDRKNKLIGTSSAADVDEIIEFTRLVKKSGITIEQCAQGFRLINVLKELKALLT